MEKKRLIEITVLLISKLESAKLYEKVYCFTFIIEDLKDKYFSNDVPEFGGICEVVHQLRSNDIIDCYEHNYFLNSLQCFRDIKGGKCFGYWFPRDERTIERRLEFLKEYLEFLKK